jgi:two-component SAPR family response regulator
MKASTLLKKYEWFKDAAAQLDKKQADIAMYESMVEETKKDYGPDQSKWPRDVRETQSQRKTEMLGVKSSYNSLAAEYNAAMAKINYEFCNVGDLPRGATKPLPRAFKPYETK